jgi:DNA-directed RNA polymerase subunit K/omega
MPPKKIVKTVGKKNVPNKKSVKRNTKDKQKTGYLGDEPDAISVDSADSDETYLTGSEGSKASDKVDDVGNDIEENMDEVENEEILDGDAEIDDEDKDTKSEESESQADDDNDDVQSTGNDECMYKFAKSNNIIDDIEKIEEEDNFDDEENENKIDNKYVSSENRQTKNILNKYEKVRLLSIRSRQISLGAKPMLIGAESMNPKEVARLELEKGIMPLKIERELPNGLKEIWLISELKILE